MIGEIRKFTSQEFSLEICQSITELINHLSIDSFTFSQSNYQHRAAAWRTVGKAYYKLTKNVRITSFVDDVQLYTDFC